MPKIFAEPRTDRMLASRRWIALLIASALMHFVTIEWVGGNIGMPSLHSQDQTAIIAQLRTRQPAGEPVVAALPKRAARPKPRPVPVTPLEPAMTASAEAAPVLPPEVTEVPDSIEPVTELSPPAEAEVPAPVNAADIIPAQEPAATHYKVRLPSSAELKYDVQALRDGQMVYGSGKIGWQSDGERYTVNGNASILVFTVLDFKSAGVIDQFGVAPVIYTEKRFRKPETNTHFNRERNTISFSASTASYPREGGEQDRASIIWQLAGIGRGDTEKFVPGAEIDFFVAGVRDAETWRIQVIGQEEVEVGIGKMNAWHVVRIPRPGSYEQKLDIWLSQQQGWYPVKLRFTETNGEYLDMSLSNLTIGTAN